MRSIQSDQVETKCRLARSSNHMDGKNSSFSSSERAIMCHTNPTPYWKYILLQDTLTSAYKAGSRARNVVNPCMTTCFSTKLYDFLAHSATLSNTWWRTLNLSVFEMVASDMRYFTLLRSQRAACLLALWYELLSVCIHAYPGEIGSSLISF